MKPLKTGQLVKLRYDRDILLKVNRDATRTTPTWIAAIDIFSTTKSQEYAKIRPQPPQRLAIILEEAEEIDLDLYHKCWVLPHEESSWDGEFWFKREELEIIQQEEELQFAHQV